MSERVQTNQRGDPTLRFLCSGPEPVLQGVSSQRCSRTRVEEGADTSRAQPALITPKGHQVSVVRRSSTRGTILNLFLQPCENVFVIIGRSHDEKEPAATIRTSKQELLILGLDYFPRSALQIPAGMQPRRSSIQPMRPPGRWIPAGGEGLFLKKWHYSSSVLCIYLFTHDANWL